MLNKNILITGGAGYIGSHLSNLLFKKKYNIFIIDDLSTGNKRRLNENIIFYKCCISNKKIISNIIKKNNITHVIHLAGKINTLESQKNKKKYFDVNYKFSKIMYNVCVKHKIKKIIFASTAAVYGDYKTRFKENDQTKPINNYGASKLKFEEYLKNKKKIDYSILRFFNVAGGYYIKNLKHDNKDSVILRLYKIFKSKKKEFFISVNKENKSTRRDFIHILDLINIIERSIYNKKKNLVMNCGYGKSISILRICNEFEKFYKVKIKKIIKLKKDSDPYEVIADISLLKKLFNYSAKYNSYKKIISKISHLN